MRSLFLPLLSLFSVLSLIVSPGIVHGAEEIIQLERLKVNPDYVTVSGFSSGGSFAQQLYISHSSHYSGIAVFSHTFYRCGPVTRTQRVYDDACTTLGNRRPNELYDTRNALADIHNYFASGLIDDPRNMANKPLYVFAGTRNYLFTTDMSLRILDVFEPFINNPHLIKTRVQDANLTLPSDRRDLPACSGPPSIFGVSSCGFSGAFDALRFLLGPPAVSQPNHVRLQPLLSFDQTEFLFGVDSGSHSSGPVRYDMDAVGYLYIPTICKDNKVSCLLHLYFHGCSVGRQFVGTDHIVNSGFLEVAEQNGIVMLFPQVVTSAENDIGCWDTYGFTSPLYATKKGPQVTVVQNMLARILGEDGFHGPNIPPHTSSPALIGGAGPSPLETPLISNNIPHHHQSPLTSSSPFSPSPPIPLGHHHNIQNHHHQRLNVGVDETPSSPQGRPEGSFPAYEDTTGFGIGGHSPPSPNGSFRYRFPVGLNINTNNNNNDNNNNNFVPFNGGGVDNFNSRNFIQNNLNFHGDLETRGTDTKCRVSRLQPNTVLQRCVSN